MSLIAKIFNESYIQYYVSFIYFLTILLNYHSTGSIIDPNSAVRTVDTSSHLTRPIEEQLSYQTYKQPKITTHVRDGLDGVQNLIDDTSGLNGRGVEASKPQ